MDFKYRIVSVMRGRDQIPRGRGSARDGSHRRVVTLETTPSGRAPIDARVDRVPRATSRDAAHTSTFVMSACAQFASTAVAGYALDANDARDASARESAGDADAYRGRSKISSGRIARDRTRRERRGRACAEDFDGKEIR